MWFLYPSRFLRHNRTVDNFNCLDHFPSYISKDSVLVKSCQSCNVQESYTKPCLTLLWGFGSMKVWLHSHMISHKCSLLIFTLCRAHAGRERVLGSHVLNMSDKETLPVTCLCSVTPFCWKAEEIYVAWSANWWLFWKIRYVICKCQVQHSAELKICFSGNQIWNSLPQTPQKKG